MKLLREIRRCLFNNRFKFEDYGANTGGRGGKNVERWYPGFSDSLKILNEL